MYKLILSAQTRYEFKKLPEQHKQAILLALAEISEDPFTGKPLTRELTGKFSHKVGVYRIIYQVNKQNGIIYVSTAGHRKDVYRKK